MFLVLIQPNDNNFSITGGSNSSSLVFRDTQNKFRKSIATSNTNNPLVLLFDPFLSAIQIRGETGGKSFSSINLITCSADMILPLLSRTIILCASDFSSALYVAGCPLRSKVIFSVVVFARSGCNGRIAEIDNGLRRLMVFDFELSSSLVSASSASSFFFFDFPFSDLALANIQPPNS